MSNVMEIVENVMSVSLAATLPILYNNLGVSLTVQRNGQDDFTLVYGVNSGSETATDQSMAAVTVLGTPPITTLSTSSIGSNFAVGSTLIFTTSNTLPAPLVANTPYYVKTNIDGGNSTRTLTVSSTADGNAISFTTTGTGTHTARVQVKALITNMALNPIDMFTVGSIDDAYMYTNSSIIKVGDVISFVRVGDNKTRRYKVNSLESVGYTRQIFTRYKMASLAD